MKINVDSLIVFSMILGFFFLPLFPVAKLCYN